MQKLINHPSSAVLESLEGFALAHADLVRVRYHPHVVYRRDAPVMGKVTVISGSGSGHEPLNIGYVGQGMLDAACPGPIFTSPTPDQYLAAMQVVYGGVGLFLIVKNYMGGVLNNEMAMEMVRDGGVEVASVLIHDDVSVEQSASRRGVGAAILVEKIAGAAAEAGRPLAEVAAVAQRASEGARSMGVALSGCTAPAVGRPTFQLPEGQIEIGVGIHGERGRRRALWVKADEIVEMLAAPILHEARLRAGDRVLALVSGLGGTPQHELYIVYRQLHHLLDKRGIVVERSLVGNYITSLDMAGCTITLLRLDPELVALWDAPVHTPALRW
jgi:phosphoenolpyruvate---glycerone phosphotransferase subunit DhaK